MSNDAIDLGLTYRMLAYVQVLMMHGPWPACVYARLERIEDYLIERYSREE
jgi:hypothetical protein